MNAVLQFHTRIHVNAATVGHLKKKIQEEGKNDSLAAISARTLELWKVRAIEDLRSRIIWLTCHLCSPKRGILSI